MPAFFNSFNSRHAVSERGVQVLAVAALDELVINLVKAGGLTVSPEFLDWVADEATPMVELSVSRLFRNKRFVDSLSIGEPKIAMSLWVRHWICPQITARFAHMASDVAEFSETGPAALAADYKPTATRTPWARWAPRPLTVQRV